MEEKMLRTELAHIGKWSVILDALAYSISIPFLGFRLPFAMGLLLGTVTMLGSMWLLSRTVLRIAEQAKETGTHDRRYLKSYLLRMLMIGAAFVIAYRYRPIAALGVAIPMLYPRVIYTAGALLPQRSSGTHSQNERGENQNL